MKEQSLKNICCKIQRQQNSSLKTENSEINWNWSTAGMFNFDSYSILCTCNQYIYIEQSGCYLKRRNQYIWKKIQETSVNFWIWEQHITWLHRNKIIIVHRLKFTHYTRIFSNRLLFMYTNKPLYPDRYGCNWMCDLQHVLINYISSIPNERLSGEYHWTLMKCVQYAAHNIY